MSKAVLELARALWAQNPLSAEMDFDATFYRRSVKPIRPAIGNELRNAYISRASAELGL